MRKLLPILLVAAAASPAKPASFSAAHVGQIRCVAVLAIVANDQQRGAEGWDDVPLLTTRGTKFAGEVGERIVAESGKSRDMVRAAIIAEVAAFQQSAGIGGELPRATIESCIALMDELSPATPPPGLIDCSALITVAQRQMEAQKADPVLVTRMGVYAALLEEQARKQLIAEGKTGNESDVVLGLAREKLIADAGKRQAKGEMVEPDFEACFAQATPPKNPHQSQGHR